MEKSVEQIYVEALVERRAAGEELEPHEEAAVAYSPFGTAAGCASDYSPESSSKTAA